MKSRHFHAKTKERVLRYEKRNQETGTRKQDKRITNLEPQTLNPSQACRQTPGCRGFIITTQHLNFQLFNNNP